MQSYERAATVFQELSDHSEAANDTRTKLAMCNNNIGLLRANRGETQAALEAYGKAITLQEGLIADGAAAFSPERDLALTLGNLGLLYGQTGQIQDAWTHYERAIQIQERLLEPQPDDAIERMAMEKGLERGELSALKRGIEVALQLKFGTDGLQLLPLVREVERVEVLRAVQDPIRTAGTLDEVRRLLT